MTMKISYQAPHDAVLRFAHWLRMNGPNLMCSRPSSGELRNDGSERTASRGL